MQCHFAGSCGRDATALRSTECREVDHDVTSHVLCCVCIHCAIQVQQHVPISAVCSLQGKQTN